MDWTSIIGIVGIVGTITKLLSLIKKGWGLLKKPLYWLHGRFKSPKSLMIRLRLHPDNCRKSPFTDLIVINKGVCISVLYDDYIEETRTLAPRARVRPLTLYRDIRRQFCQTRKSTHKTFRIHPPLYGEQTLFSYKRAEHNMFYFAPHSTEIFNIPNDERWYDFLDGANRLFLIDDEGKEFNVDKKSLKLTKKQMAQMFKKQDMSSCFILGFIKKIRNILKNW